MNDFIKAKLMILGVAIAAFLLVIFTGGGFVAASSFASSVYEFIQAAKSLAFVLSLFGIFIGACALIVRIPDIIFNLIGGIFK